MSELSLRQELIVIIGGNGPVILSMMPEKNDKNVYHVTLLDQNGDYLGKCRPATARIMQRKGLIEVVSGDPFIIKLKVGFKDIKGNIDLNIVSTSK